MSTCSDPDRGDTDDEVSQRSYSNASSPSASLQAPPNYVRRNSKMMKEATYFASESFLTFDDVFAGSLRVWWSNNRGSKPSPLPLRSLPSGSRFSPSPDWAKKPILLPDPPPNLPSTQAGAQLPAQRLALLRLALGSDKKQSSFT